MIVLLPSIKHILIGIGWGYRIEDNGHKMQKYIVENMENKQK